MQNKTLRTVLFVSALIAAYYGFRFVTQAGQGLGVVQNDGYGGTGGILILISGVILGLLIEQPRGKK